MQNKWAKMLKRYDEVVELLPDIERKGKTMPYTSVNGHMFSLLNKDGELGIRIGTKSAATFVEKYKTKPYKSHGAFLKGYVLVPEKVLKDTLLLKDLFEDGHRYALSLKPK